MGFPSFAFRGCAYQRGEPGLLPEILNRSSRLPVLYAVHNAPILPARVYIAPAGARHMTRGKIRLLPGPRENRTRPAIDALFRSASHAYGSEVIGVVLTGNLDDGGAGLADIKIRGGIAMVQDPDEAMAPSMPATALETADVDYVLPAESIGPKLVELAATEAVERLRPSNGEKNMVPAGLIYSCPECGGVLKEIEENGIERYRCRVGHLYSAESLLADQGLGVEKALWAAIRTLEEQAEFAEKLADSSRKKQHARLVTRFSEKARQPGKCLGPPRFAAEGGRSGLRNPLQRGQLRVRVPGKWPGKRFSSYSKGAEFSWPWQFKNSNHPECRPRLRC